MGIAFPPRFTVDLGKLGLSLCRRERGCAQLVSDAIKGVTITDPLAGAVALTMATASQGYLRGLDDRRVRPSVSSRPGRARA
jgi:hypothetical protein